MAPEPKQTLPELKILPRGCYVILHIGLGPSQLQEKSSSPLIVKEGDRFELSDDIWLEMLDKDTAKHVQTACDPPHYKIDSADHGRHLYAFVMRVPEQQQIRYDRLDILHAVISLSGWFIRQAPGIVTARRLCTMDLKTLLFMRSSTEVQARMFSWTAINTTGLPWKTGRSCGN